MAVKLVPALISSAALAAAIYASYCYIKKLSKNRCPKQWKKVGKVQKLYLFPLKSGRFIELQSAECTILGLRTIVDANNPLQLRDRSFVVYGVAEKEVKSGRQLPTLVNIKVSIHDEKNIELEAAQMTSMLLQVPQSTEQNKVFLKTHSGEKIEAFDCGDEAAKWISQFIHQIDSGYRMAYHDASKRRDLVRHQKRMEFYENMTDKATGLFSDVSSILIINQASLDEYLKRSDYANVSNLNFRPNIVIDDPDLQPFDEDSWEWLKIGDKIIMRNVKECTRCIFTTVDPETGIRSTSREPLKTLSKYRVSKGPENAPIMGIHTEVKVEGIINVGDEIFIGVDEKFC